MRRFLHARQNSSIVEISDSVGLLILISSARMPVAFPAKDIWH